MTEEKKKIEPVVTATRRRTPVSEKIAKTFFKGDNLADIGSYLIQDVVIPTVIDTIVDVIQKGTSRLFYGDDRGVGRSSSRGRDPEKYNRISTLGSSRRSDRRDVAKTREYNKVYRGYESIYLERRGDAEEVVDHLDILANEYDCVSVADLYDLVGITTTYTDNKWGWYKSDVARAQIRRVRGGYTVDLPEPEPLD